MKNRIFWFTFTISAFLLLGVFASHIYWGITGFVRGEAFYEGRPTSYWREQIKTANRLRRHRIFFGADAKPVTWREQFESWRNRHLPDEIANMEKDQGALPVWRELLTDGDSELRVAAFHVTVEHRQEADLPKLVDFVMDDSEDRKADLREMISRLYALLEIGDAYDGGKDGAFYKNWLGHPNPMMRRTALEGLWGYVSGKPDPQTVAQIASLTGDPDASVRERGIEFLADLGKHAAPSVPKLKEISENDPNPRMREIAATAIARITAAKWTTFRPLEERENTEAVKDFSA